jgi:hypothetical protein
MVPSCSSRLCIGLPDISLHIFFFFRKCVHAIKRISLRQAYTNPDSSTAAYELMKYKTSFQSSYPERTVHISTRFSARACGYVMKY